MQTKLLTKPLLFLLILFFITVSAFAQIQSAQSGNWNATTTWVGGIVPTASDDVIINTNHNVVTNGINPLYNSLIISGTISTYNTVSFENDIINENEFIINNGSHLQGAGKLTNNGTVTTTGTVYIEKEIINNSNEVVNINGTVYSNTTATLTNYGTLNLGTINTNYSGNIYLDVINESTGNIVGNGNFLFRKDVTNKAGGVVTVNTNKYIQFYYGSTLTNAGNFEGAGLVFLNNTDATFNGGTFGDGTGILYLNGTVNIFGSVDFVPNFGTVNHNSATVTGTDTSMVIPESTVYTMSNGIIQGFTQFTNNGIFHANGYPRFENDIINNKEFNINGYVYSNTNSTLFNHGTFNINYNHTSGARPFEIDVTNESGGQVNRLGADNYYFYISTDFINKDGGTVTVGTSKRLYFNGGTLTNAGDFEGAGLVFLNNTDATFNGGAFGDGTGSLILYHAVNIAGSVDFVPNFATVNHSSATITGIDTAMEIPLGTIYNMNSGTIQGFDQVTNNGTANVRGILNNDFINNNEFKLSGTVNSTNNSKLINTATATIKGYGNFQLDVTNESGGVITPTNSYFNFLSDLTNKAGGIVTAPANRTLEFRGTLTNVGAFEGAGRVNLRDVTATFNGGSFGDGTGTLYLYYAVNIAGLVDFVPNFTTVTHPYYTTLTGAGTAMEIPAGTVYNIAGYSSSVPTVQGFTQFTNNGIVNTSARVNFENDIINENEFNINSGSHLEGAGILTNNGTVNTTGSVYIEKEIINNSDKEVNIKGNVYSNTTATLTNYGTLNLGTINTNYSGNIYLDVINESTGNIVGNGNFSFRKDVTNKAGGVVTVNTNKYIQFTSGTLTNAGAFNGDGRVYLNTSDATFNGGTFGDGTGTLDLYGTVNIFGLVDFVPNFATVNHSYAIVTGTDTSMVIPESTVYTMNSGIIQGFTQFTNNGIFHANGTPRFENDIKNNKEFNINGYVYSTANSTLFNHGTFNINYNHTSSTIPFQIDVTNESGGQVNRLGADNYYFYISTDFINKDGGTVTVGTSKRLYFNGGTLTNAGNFEGAGLVFLNNTDATFNGGSFGDGTGSLILYNAVNIAGSVDFVPNFATVNHSGATVTGTNTAMEIPLGTIYNMNNGTIQGFDQVTNNGTANIRGILNNDFINNKEFNLTGTLSSTNNSKLINNDTATIKGSGNFQLDVTNESGGVITPNSYFYFYSDLTNKAGGIVTAPANRTLEFRGTLTNAGDFNGAGRVYLRDVDATFNGGSFGDGTGTLNLYYAVNIAGLVDFVPNFTTVTHPYYTTLTGAGTAMEIPAGTVYNIAGYSSSVPTVQGFTQFTNNGIVNTSARVNFENDIINENEFNINSGSHLEGAGILTNNGTVNTTGSVYIEKEIINNSDKEVNIKGNVYSNTTATLTNYGTLNLGTINTNYSGNIYLDVINESTGNIVGNGNFSFRKDVTNKAGGVVTVNTNKYIQFTSGTLTNAGAFNGDGRVYLNTSDATFNGGTFGDGTGTLDLYGTVNIFGLVDFVPNFATVNHSYAIVTGTDTSMVIPESTVYTMNSGIIQGFTQFTNNGIFHANGTPRFENDIKNNKEFNINGYVYSTANSTLFNHGTFNINYNHTSSTIPFQIDVTNESGGQVNRLGADNYYFYISTDFINKDGGTVTVGTSKRLYFNGGTLTNAGNFEGAGLVFLNNTDATFNGGSFGDGTGSLILYNAVNIAGSVDFVPNFATVNHSSATITGTDTAMEIPLGTIYNMNNGTIQGFDQVTNNGIANVRGILNNDFINNKEFNLTGTLSSTNNSKLINNDTATIKGSGNFQLDVTNESGGVITPNSYFYFYSDLTNKAGGIVTAPANRTLEFRGTLTNAGAFEGAGRVYLRDVDATFNGGSFGDGTGTLYLYNAVNIAGSVDFVPNFTTVTHPYYTTLTGAGTAMEIPAGTVYNIAGYSNNYVPTVQGFTQFTNNGIVNTSVRVSFENDIINENEFNINFSSHLLGAGNLINNGTVNTTNIVVIEKDIINNFVINLNYVISNTNKTLTNFGTINLNNTGSISLDVINESTGKIISNGQTTFYYDFINKADGLVTINNSSRLNFVGPSINNGNVISNGDVYHRALIEGIGNFSGTNNYIFNSSNSKLSPGISGPGCLTYEKVHVRGTYLVDINGSSDCSEYDRIVVNDIADITGSKLELSFNYTPTNNDIITIIDAGSVLGTFNLNAPLPEDWTLEYNYPNTGEVSLKYFAGVIPEIACPVNITDFSDDDKCGAIVTFAATETVGIPASTITYSHQPGDEFPVGITTVTATATNSLGSSECTFTITVTDDELPVIIASDAITQTADEGLCGAMVTIVDPTATDNCSVGAVTGTRDDEEALTALYPVGITTITWTVTDINNNVAAEVTQTVTITDDEIPVITAADAVTQTADEGVCGAIVAIVDAAVTDNCTAETVMGLRDDGEELTALYPVGITTITWEVTDINNNDAVAVTQTVTVTDDEVPVIACQNITVPLDEFGNASIEVDDVDGGASDNCAVASIAIVTDSSGGEQLVTNGSFANGSDGGYAWAKFNIDTNAGWQASGGDPNQYFKLQGDGNGEPSILQTLNNLQIGKSYTITGSYRGFETPNSIDVFAVELDNVVLAELPNPGTDWTTFSVTFEATAISHNIKFRAEINGTGVAIGVDKISTLQPIAYTTESSIDFDCSNIGANEVTLLVMDVNGNSATCTGNVTVEDNIVPVITCVGDGTQSTDLGTCTYTIIGTEFDATFTDNCTDGRITNNFNNSDSLDEAVFQKGATDVIWTVDDGNGQTTTCITTITVEDNEDPVITCVGDGTRSTDLGACTYTIVGTAFDATFTDNCTDGSITNNFNNSDSLDEAVFQKGATDVIWTVDDGNGQTATCTTTITVEDNEAPVISCVGDGTRSTDLGACTYTIVGTEFDTTFTDNCDDGSITNDYNSSASLNGAVFQKGATDVVWTVNDGNGQTATCTTTIIVEDNEDPEISCISNQERYVDPYETFYTVDGTEFDATATDNCGIASITYTGGSPSTSGSSMDSELLTLGTNTMSWTAIDVNGNDSDCSTDVTVIKRPTSLAYNGDEDEQYSDSVVLSATLTDDISPGGGVQGKTITFTIGTQSTTAVTNTNGVASTTLILTQDPANTYTVNAEFTEDASYLGSSDNKHFDITQEDAIVNYIGNEITATQSAYDLTATLDLRVSVQDLADGYRGDIRNATVSFVLDGTEILSPTPISQLVDPYTGVISLSHAVALSNSTSETFTLEILIGGYYSASDQTVITVYVPTGEFITGGGHIIPTTSAGTYPSTTGTKTNFGFNVKFNKNGRKLKGKLNFIWRSNGRVYQAKSNATDALSVDISDEDALTAVFTSKCNYSDITDPLYPISLGGNKIMHVSMTDRGEPGENDDISFTLWDGNELIYSSNWTGVNSIKQVLNGGNLVVHSGRSVGNNSSKDEEPIVEELFDSLELVSWPNPSDDYFNIKLNSKNTLDKIYIQVFDINNRLVSFKTGVPNRDYKIGASLQAGLYFINVTQANTSKQVKLIKY